MSKIEEIKNSIAVKGGAMRYLGFLVLFSAVVIGETTAVKVEGIPTEPETTISIKKGAPVVGQQCIEYQIIEGSEEVNGQPDFDRKKAYQDWKSECDRWKISMKEINKTNEILTINCNKPKSSRDGEMLTYASSASYKMKVKVKESKN